MLGRNNGPALLKSRLAAEVAAVSEIAPVLVPLTKRWSRASAARESTERAPPVATVIWRPTLTLAKVLALIRPPELTVILPLPKVSVVRPVSELTPLKVNVPRPSLVRPPVVSLSVLSAEGIVTLAP